MEQRHLRSSHRTEAEPHDGHATPSGHLMSRMVRKHLASSKRSWMFTMTGRLADPIAAAVKGVRDLGSYPIRPPHAPSPRNPS